MKGVWNKLLVRIYGGLVWGRLEARREVRGWSIDYYYFYIRIRAEAAAALLFRDLDPRGRGAGVVAICVA